MSKLKFRCPKCGCNELVMHTEGVSIEQRVQEIRKDQEKSFIRLDPLSIKITDYNWDEWSSETEDYKPYALHYGCAQCLNSAGSYTSTDTLISGMKDKGWVFLEEDE